MLTIRAVTTRVGGRRSVTAPSGSVIGPTILGTRPSAGGPPLTVRSDDAASMTRDIPFAPSGIRTCVLERAAFTIASATSRHSAAPEETSKACADTTTPLLSTSKLRWALLTIGARLLRTESRVSVTSSPPGTRPNSISREPKARGRRAGSSFALRVTAVRMAAACAEGEIFGGGAAVVGEKFHTVSEVVAPLGAGVPSIAPPCGISGRASAVHRARGDGLRFSLGSAGGNASSVASTGDSRSMSVSGNAVVLAAVDPGISSSHFGWWLRAIATQRCAAAATSKHPRSRCGVDMARHNARAKGWLAQSTAPPVVMTEIAGQW